MGTTIRREPITTAIPAAPDYRFLNITNFGGIEKSSNPFVVESNTASDCLNVYVDEDNALSTRPRLQHQTDFIKDIINKFPALGLTGAFDLIGVYDSHDGYLIHGVENDIYYMFKYIDKNSIRQITGTDIPKDKCKIFEQNGNIYILDGEKYRNIIGDVISEVEGYVPTTKVGKTNTTDGTNYEPLNLLTKTFKESYLWDASWNVNEITTSEQSITNQYIESKLVSRGYGNNVVKKIYRDSLDSDKLHFLTWVPGASDWYDYTYDVAKDEWSSKTISLPSQITNYHEKTQLDCSKDGSVLALRRWGVDSNTDGLYVSRNNVWTKLDTSGYSFSTLGGWATSNHVKISSDGNIIIAVTNDVFAEGESATILIFEYNNNGTYEKRIVTYKHEKYDYPYHIITGLEMSTNDLVGFILSDWSQNLPDSRRTASNATRFNVYFDDEETSIEVSDADNTVARSDSSGHISDLTSDGVHLAAVITKGDASKIHFYDDIYAVNWNNVHSAYTMLEAEDFNGKKVPTVQPVFYNNKLYVTEGLFDVNTKKYVRLLFGDNKIPNSGYRDDDYYYYTNSEQAAKFVDSEYMCFMYEDVIFDLVEQSFKDFVHINKLNFNSSEPLLIITRQLSDNDESYAEHKNNNILVTASKLFTRFDNNTWFASGNYTFHTLYNDPTYVPLSSYNDLGEDYEPITGLSIVNDNILAAYKRNRIYIITPIAVGNELTYSYTETKNIVGNDVVDAPILTILTEMPVIVSYDGIYALNQLENVQSSDRITTLISEAMNPKWLKESSEDIDRCLTMNRLYWTYFILPHKKSTNGLIKDNNHTKVYLLDNRTGSWFYWELPIYVISATIKNNKTHFVTEDGELFTLETTDIINKFNKDLTEYYDDLKKPTPIPWNWTSQILSLNTINYSKRLVDTTFVLTDTDISDEYALNYKFKAFRKNKNAETTELTLTNDIEYVESITKRTMIPRFNFIQFTLSNTEDDEKLNNNKLRLVGLGLKYVLLGGLY